MKLRSGSFVAGLAAALFGAGIRSRESKPGGDSGREVDFVSEKQGFQRR